MNSPHVASDGRHAQDSAVRPTQKDRSAYDRWAEGAPRSIWRRGRDSNPRCRLPHTHAFQACSLNHSDTSPGSASCYQCRTARTRARLGEQTEVYQRPEARSTDLQTLPRRRPAGRSGVGQNQASEAAENIVQG